VFPNLVHKRHRDDREKVKANEEITMVLFRELLRSWTCQGVLSSQAKSVIKCLAGGEHKVQRKEVIHLLACMQLPAHSSFCFLAHSFFHLPVVGTKMED
jgi:hypothetical protein